MQSDIDSNSISELVPYTSDYMHNYASLVPSRGHGRTRISSKPDGLEAYYFRPVCRNNKPPLLAFCAAPYCIGYVFVGYATFVGYVVRCLHAGNAGDVASAKRGFETPAGSPLVVEKRMYIACSTVVIYL